MQRSDEQRGKLLAFRTLEPIDDFSDLIGPTDPIVAAVRSGRALAERAAILGDEIDEAPLAHIADDDLRSLIEALQSAAGAALTEAMRRGAQ